MIEDDAKPPRRISRRTRGERTKRRERYLVSNRKDNFTLENTCISYDVSASSAEANQYPFQNNNYDNIHRDVANRTLNKMRSGADSSDRQPVDEAKGKPGRKPANSPKSSKQKRSYSLIKKLKFKSKSSPACAPGYEKVTGNLDRPSTSSASAPSERRTPEGDDNLILTKSASATNLQETWNSADNLTKDNAGSSTKSAAAIEFNQFYGAKEQRGLRERTKSLENLKDMPAYGELILDHSSSMSNANQVTNKPKDHLYKILVIGDLGTGKTSIIKRYVHRFFTQHYRATIGVDFALKVLNWDDNTLIRLQLWDIAGQERYGNMTRVYYKEAVGAFIVFDVTRKNTYDSVANWKSDLDSKVQLPDGSPIPCVLLANKSDQLKESLSNNKEMNVNQYCQDNGFTAWFETSARDNINIDEAARALVEKILEHDSLLNNESKKTGDQFVIKDSNDQKNGRKFCSC